MVGIGALPECMSASDLLDAANLHESQRIELSMASAAPENEQLTPRYKTGAFLRDFMYEIIQRPRT